MNMGGAYSNIDPTVVFCNIGGKRPIFCLMHGVEGQRAERKANMC